MGKGLKDAFLQRRPTHDQQVYENVLSFSACVLSCFSRVQLFVTHWTLVRQAPLSMGFSRQEYWSGLPFLTPGDLPYPGMEPCLLCLQHWQSGSLPLAPSGKPMASMMQWIWTWCKLLQEIVRDREAQHASAHGVTKSQTRLGNWTTATFLWCPSPPRLPYCSLLGPFN